MSVQEFHLQSRDSGVPTVKQADVESDSRADVPETAVTTQTLMQSAGNAAISQALDQKEMGSPLEPGFRTQMEHALCADFGNVRVRDDSAARNSAEAIEATAFTRGEEIFLGHDAPS